MRTISPVINVVPEATYSWERSLLRAFFPCDLLPRGFGFVVTAAAPPEHAAWPGLAAPSAVPAKFTAEQPTNHPDRSVMRESWTYTFPLPLLQVLLYHCMAAARMVGHSLVRQKSVPDNVWPSTVPVKTTTLPRPTF
jgi:hypothetical protein